MKKSILLGTLIALGIQFNSMAQLTFSVSPGLQMNGVSFGYKMKKLVPFIGFQNLSTSFYYERTGEEFDYNTNAVVSYKSTYDYKVNLSIPTLGLKYFILEKESLKAYGTLCVTKPILSGRAKIDGETDEYTTDYAKNLSFFGSELGFGMEYFFNTQFSIGGEFGLRYIRVSYKDVYEDTFYNPVTDANQTTTINEKINYSFSPTYSKLALNFYF
jgi:hypothetical protein